MRFMILPVLLVICAPIFSYPAADGVHISDYAGLLNPADKEAISELIASCEKERGIKLKLFIINSVSDYPEAPQNFEDFSRGLLGRVFENGNSAKAGLMVVAVKDRKVTIEMGAPLETAYARGAGKIIREKVVPYFKNNDYSRGIFMGINSLKNLFGGAKNRKNMPFLLFGAVLIAAAAAGAAVLAVKNKKGVQREPLPKKEPAGEFGGGAWGKWQ